MTRKLSQMTWEELKEELSIASDRDKLIKLGRDIYESIAGGIDAHNLAEVEMMQLVLKKIIAELKNWERIERNRQHPKQ